MAWIWLLWLWCRQAAVAPIQPLAWELPHAKSAALKSGAGGKIRFISLSGINFSLLVAFITPLSEIHMQRYSFNTILTK